MTPQARPSRYAYVPFLVLSAAAAACTGTTMRPDVQTIDSPVAPPLRIVANRAPEPTCEGIVLNFDVQSVMGRDAADVPTLTFTFSIVDPAREFERTDDGSCGDAGVAGRACFDGLMPNTEYFIRVRVSSGGETATSVFFVRTSSCGDGGMDAADAVVRDTPVVDVGIDSTPSMDATLDVPADVRSDVPTDVQSDVPADVQSDVPADVQSDLGTDASDTAVDASSDVADEAALLDGTG